MTWSFVSWLQGLYQRFGPLRFFAGVALALGWFVLGVRLGLAAHWPPGCDHGGRRSVGMVKKLSCSPDLLGGGPVELAYFVWLWSLPLILVVTFVWVYIAASNGKGS